MPEGIVARRQFIVAAGALAVGGCRGIATVRPRVRPSRWRAVATLPKDVGRVVEIVVGGGSGALVVGESLTVMITGDRRIPLGADVQGIARAAAVAEAFLFAGGIYGPDGTLRRKLPGGGLYHAGGVVERCVAVERGYWTTVAQLEGARSAPVLFVQHRRLAGKAGGDERYAFEVEGTGTGARARDGRVVLALDDGRVMLLAPRRSGGWTPAIVFEREVDPSPYAVAVDDDGISLLCAGERPSAKPHPSAGTEGAGPSIVVRLGLDGREAGRCELAVSGEHLLPWPARGRMVVVGRGLAVLEGSRVAWAQPDGAQRWATVAGTGLIVAQDRELSVFDGNGRVRGRASLADGPAVCSPVVDRTGGVWVATSHTLWRRA